MLTRLLKHHEYPMWLFLGAPENGLDLFSFILFLGYMLIKFIGSLPLWTDLVVAVIYFLIFLIFKRYAKDHKLTSAMNHALSFMIFFGLWYVIEVFF